MFHIKFLVDDKHLAGVLATLGNKVLNLDIAHVTNAAAGKSGKVSQVHNAGSIRDALMPALIDAYPEIMKGATFTKDMVATTIAHLGGSEASAQSMIKVLIDRKQVKRQSRGTYVKGAK